MYSKSSILARPGWSQNNFDKLLSDPDDIKINYGSAKMQFYKKERVIDAENSYLFRILKQKYKSRIYEVAETHILPNDIFADELRNIKIEVAVFTLGRVQQGAIGYYNAERKSGFVNRRTSESILFNIMVPYIKDVLTKYDRQFEDHIKNINATTTLRAIRYSVYMSIAKTYPELQKHCHEHYEKIK